MPTITETLKSKLDEFELERRLDELTVATEKAVKRAIEHAGDLAHDNRDKVATLLDKAGSAIDDSTDGKYHETVGKVRAQVVSGVDKLATKRPATHHTPFDTAASEASNSAHATETAQASETAQDAPTAWSAHTDQV